CCPTTVSSWPGRPCSSPTARWRRPCCPTDGPAGTRPSARRDRPRGPGYRAVMGTPHAVAPVRPTRRRLAAGLALGVAATLAVASPSTAAQEGHDRPGHGGR